MYFIVRALSYGLCGKEFLKKRLLNLVLLRILEKICGAVDLEIYDFPKEMIL